MNGKRKSFAKSPLAPLFKRGVRGIFSIVAAVIAVTSIFAHAGHDDEYVETIGAERVKKMLDGGEKIFIVDMRPAADFQKARLPGALSIPIADLAKRLNEIPKAGRVVLYCACPPGGVDESYSYLMLRGKGHRNAVVLQDGFSAWTLRKYPTEPK
jgi:rhodanese-related sulfurtransferase